MKKLLLFSATIISLFAFSSCERQQVPTDVTKNAFLENRNWTLTSIMYCDNMDVEVPVYTDLFTTMLECQKDNFYFFETKSTGKIYEYWIKCSDTDPDEYPFYYTISDNDTYIKIYNNPDDIENSILIQGKMETPDIDHFVVTYDWWDVTLERNKRIVHYFEKIVPTF